MKFISLFAGIGGFDLGLERAGMECVAQVEIDDFCQKVLSKHWPDVPKFKDVRDVGKHNLPAANLICGGFPCQDVSLAGERAGLEGKRSTLWSEFHRIICEVQPRWVIIENVLGLLSSDNGGFFRKILWELSESGYDAEWQVISAENVGAPHKRERVFIIAYPKSNGRTSVYDGMGKEAKQTSNSKVHKPIWGYCAPVHIPSIGRTYVGMGFTSREDDGLSCGVDGRLKSTGNAVVPQVAELVGRAIMQTEQGDLNDA